MNGVGSSDLSELEGVKICWHISIISIISMAHLSHVVERDHFKHLTVNGHYDTLKMDLHDFSAFLDV